MAAAGDTDTLLINPYFISRRITRLSENVFKCLNLEDKLSSTLSSTMAFLGYFLLKSL